MTIRTSTDLIDKIADQLAWRRKELLELRTMIEASRVNKGRQATLIRAGIALLYAHWEGFIKCTGTHFLEFVSGQGRTHSELKPNFIGVILRKRLNAAMQSKKTSATGEIVDFICSKMASRAHVPSKGIVDTESNLSSKVLSDILWTLGLDAAPYETKKKMLDESLLARRNHIAHGEALDVSVEDYLKLHDEVLLLLESFRTQIENACVNSDFLRPATPAIVK